MTKIEWTERTWNPITGCTAISPGCANCYARRMAHRLAGRVGYPAAPNEFDVTLRPERLGEPLSWRKPSTVFVCSMADLFHKDVPDEWIDEIWATMLLTPEHTYQVLTKRADRMREFLTAMPIDPVPPNIWIGVTAEDQQRANERIPYLLQTPAAVRFVSVEPMIGPVDLRPAHDAAYDTGVCPVVKVGWIIIGAETGPGRRPCRLEWVRNLVQQCQAAGVAVFVKKLEIDGKVTGNVADWPADLRVREYPR